MFFSSITPFLLLVSTTSAFTIRTTPSPPAPTLDPRDTVTSAPTTSAVEFITTKYITIQGQTNAHVTLAPQTITLALPTCIQTITPDANGYVPPGTCNALYDYYPSFVAAVVATVAFGLLTVAHIAQAAIYKKAFCWVLIMGSLWEFISFAARSVSTRYQQNVGLLLVSQLFVLIAPLWINAFAYMLLARLIYFYHPARSLLRIPASILSSIFVLLDVVSFVIQIVGGSYAGPTAPEDQQMKGVHIYMGGIGIQQFFIVVFVALAVKFYLEMNELEKSGVVREGWRRLLWTLFGSLGFITIRIIFRLAEFSAGKTSSNPLPFHEAYFYVLEAVPMFLAILCFNVTHPGCDLTGVGSELPGLRETFWRKRMNRAIIEDEDGLEMKGLTTDLLKSPNVMSEHDRCR